MIYGNLLFVSYHIVVEVPSRDHLLILTSCCCSSSSVSVVVRIVKDTYILLSKDWISRQDLSFQPCLTIRRCIANSTAARIGRLTANKDKFPQDDLFIVSFAQSKSNECMPSSNSSTALPFKIQDTEHAKILDKLIIRQEQLPQVALTLCTPSVVAVQFLDGFLEIGMR